MHGDTHRTVRIRETELAVRERGAGPAVVLCHGFPGLGYSYRHQLSALADAGFRAIAPDMLGYGGSSAPADPSEYTYERITRDLVGLLDALEIPDAVFVGHDFGAPAAWNVALRARARTRGLVLLSVPYDPDAMPRRPTEIYAAMAKKHFLHIHYFQTPGVAERELDARPREFLARLYYALSGAYHYLDVWKHPSEGRGYLDVLPEAPPLPWSWLTEADLDVYAETFARTGFRGGLNWYRAFDVNWERGGPWFGAEIEVPTLFVAGAEDAVVKMRGEAGIARMRAVVPDLRGVHVLPGVGHWVQQEAADAVNAHLIAFLRAL